MPVVENRSSLEKYGDRRDLRFVLVKYAQLNQSQGGMYICWVLRIRRGVAQEGLCP